MPWQNHLAVPKFKYPGHGCGGDGFVASRKSGYYFFARDIRIAREKHFTYFKCKTGRIVTGSLIDPGHYAIKYRDTVTVMYEHNISWSNL